MAHDHADDGLISFEVWPKDGTDADARTFLAPTAQRAAEKCAREDWLAGATTWPTSYGVRSRYTGQLWVVDVILATQPSFIAIDAREVPMPPATHVLWGGNVLCEDQRLRGVPRDWPEGQRWISLQDVADGVTAPCDPCDLCWDKAPGFVAELRQIGKR